MTPLERAAKALFDLQLEGDPDARWGYAPPIVKSAWLASARAALQAIREPSETMLTVGTNLDGDLEAASSSFAVPEIWRAMIDAALEEG